MYDKLDYLEILKKNLRVMDATAASLCLENRIPIIVFNLYKQDNLKNIVLGNKVGTLVS